MLRLTVNNIPASATYLKIDFNGKKVQGDFSIASLVTPGTSTIETSATNGTDDIITVTGLTGAATTYDINLPLPTGEYTDITVTAYNSNDAAVISIVRPMKTSGTYTAIRAKGREVTATLPVFTINQNGTKVAFAPGNLQATWNGSTWTWHFAEHQWDYTTINTDGTSVNGMILFPDGVTIASSEATTWGTINNTSDWNECTKCTSAQWTALAAKGCVFLPAAGYRSGTAVWNASSYGYYWTSNCYAVVNAYCVIFDDLSSWEKRDRDTGCSVRLVRVVQ
jgi:hypothetical protein